MIERLWVEVNSRINYPVKRVLVEMENYGEINMTDSLHKYYVSWVSIEVLVRGAQTFIRSWNSHTIPGKLSIYIAIYTEKHNDNGYTTLL